MIRTKRPLRLGTSAESAAMGAIESDDVREGDPVGTGTGPRHPAPTPGLEAESWLGVPILIGERVIGVIALEAFEKHAFDESTERLLGTIATSMAGALENARLFDETRRLLGEADERAAELTVINEIGEALVRQLEFDAIIQLVGERVRALFEVQSIFIALHDPVTNLIAFPYDLDEGVPFERGTLPFGPGLTSTVITTGRSLADGQRRRADGRRGDPGRRHGHPLVARRSDHRRERRHRRPRARERRGERVHRGGRAADRRPLPRAWASRSRTPACSTRRSGCSSETDERAAELAIVNEVQQGLAAQIEMQAMYDLVGDRLRDVFDAQVLDIGILDREAGLIHFPYTIERGVRFPDEPIRLMGIRRHVIETREPLLMNDRAARARG